ncbi:MAG TPA: hypothetical protein VGV92_08680 [Gammaproteobacteria bacterium]|nr:hypothetical protein [Gammaproteobacteria bacterium]
MASLSIPTSFIRKLYIVTHQPISHLHRFHETGFSKFVTIQTLNEFKDAGYNDSVSGEVYEDEALAKARLNDGEFYLVVEVEAEAIAYRAQDGAVYLNRGHIPKIKSLKTATGEIYSYDKSRGFQREVKPKMTVNSSIIYGYNPSVWDLRSLVRDRN